MSGPILGPGGFSSDRRLQRRPDWRIYVKSAPRPLRAHIGRIRADGRATARSRLECNVLTGLQSAHLLANAQNRRTRHDLRRRRRR